MKNEKLELLDADPPQICFRCAEGFEEYDSVMANNMAYYRQQMVEMRRNLDHAKDILANCLKDIECGETGRCKARLRMYAIMPNAPEEEGKDEN